MRFVNKDNIKKMVDYKKLVGVMKDALVDIDLKESIVPDRHHVESFNGSVFLFMPVVSEKLGYVAFKYVGVCPENLKKDIPAINGFVMLADLETGIPKIFFDGAELTSVRTGAVGGAAIDLLAVENAEVASVFGTGPQARTQIEAMVSVRRIKKINLFYRNKDKAENFARQFHNMNIVLTDNIQELEESDIIIAATNSEKPLFNMKDINLKPWVHINAVGSFKPDMQEVDEQVYGEFEVFADNKDGCFAESGDFIIAENKGLLNRACVKNLGEVILNNEQIKDYKNKKTVFKSVGNAVFDLYTAVHFSKLIDTKSEKLFRQ